MYSYTGHEEKLAREGMGLRRYIDDGGVVHTVHYMTRNWCAAATIAKTVSTHKEDALLTCLWCVSYGGR